ncbi:Mitochondrial inner membrane protease atp23 [Pseudocyphellaria aurata]|nr:Mitochondrial inner membrane protease atp23 [Pseudocyphellaria aurata]
MSDAEQSKASDTKKRKFIPSDDAYQRWCNAFNYLLGRFSDEDIARYFEKFHDRTQQYDCDRCEKHRDSLLQFSPIIRFMRQNINKLGGDMNADNIRCRRCYSWQAGGFDPNYGILICANHVKRKAHVETTIAHEMVHAYDHLRFKMQWQNNLRHAACTEIRASALSGECRWTEEFFSRFNFKVTQQHQECVRRRAALSVKNRPECKDDVHAAKMVNEVWDSCYPDTRPFDEIYK